MVVRLLFGPEDCVPRPSSSVRYVWQVRRKQPRWCTTVEVTHTLHIKARVVAGIDGPAPSGNASRGLSGMDMMNALSALAALRVVKSKRMKGELDELGAQWSSRGESDPVTLDNLQDHPYISARKLGSTRLCLAKVGPVPRRRAVLSWKLSCLPEPGMCLWQHGGVDCVQCWLRRCGDALLRAQPRVNLRIRISQQQAGRPSLCCSECPATRDDLAIFTSVS